MIDFQPSEDHVLLRDAVAGFAKTSLLGNVRRFEQAREVSQEVRQQAQEMGLGMGPFPEALGGQGFGLLATVMLEEELGAVDAGAAFGLAGPHAFGIACAELGTEAQAKAQLADFCGSDGHDRFGAVAWSEDASHPTRAGFVTEAVRDGDAYVLTGKKVFVGNASRADRFLVFAQVDAERGWDGFGAFVVRRDQDGVSVGTRHDTLGLDAGDFGPIELDGVRVPETLRLSGGDDFTLGCLTFFAKHALVVAAREVGVARFAWEIAREHCDTRKAFGKPIGHFQAVAFALSDRLMDVESARWMLWSAAHAWDAVSDGSGRAPAALLRTAQAAAHSHEAVMRCTDDCVGLHGGSGFIRDLIAEKLMRDAKQLALCGPTAEHWDQVASALELGAKLDPALVLPTPDTQAIFT